MAATSLMESFDGTSVLMIGTGLLVSLLVIQILWAYRNRTGSGSVPASGVEGVEVEAGSVDGATMVLCPECSEPTEAEYRYCRNCAEDTGKSYIGSPGDGDSNRSGIL